MQEAFIKSLSLNLKRKRAKSDGSFVMKIRRTATSWLIQDRGVSGPVPVGPVHDDPVSLSPAPDLPPLRLRKTGSTNWSFLPKVFFNNFHSRSLVKSVLFRRELMRRVLSDNIWRQEDYYGKMSQVHHLPQMKSPLLGLRLPSSQLRGSPG